MFFSHPVEIDLDNITFESVAVNTLQYAAGSLLLGAILAVLFFFLSRFLFTFKSSKKAV